MSQYEKEYWAKPENKARKRDRARERIKSNPLKYMLQAAKARSVIHGREFNLKETDFTSLPLYCSIKGYKLDYLKTKPTPWSHSASLDRIDQTRGYTIDNVQIISQSANSFKENKYNDSK